MKIKINWTMLHLYDTTVTGNRMRKMRCFYVTILIKRCTPFVQELL